MQVRLVDTLITAEKHGHCPSVINCYRKTFGRYFVNAKFLLKFGEMENLAHIFKLLCIYSLQCATTVAAYHGGPTSKAIVPFLT